MPATVSGGVPTAARHQLLLGKVVGEEVVDERGHVRWPRQQHVEVFKRPERKLFVHPAPP